MKKLLIASIYILPLFARAEVYIDQIKENGRHYVIIETDSVRAKVEVSSNDTDDERVAKVCKVVRCNGKK